MPRPAIVAIDLVAITILTFLVYFPRYRRKDMVVAYLGLNICVTSVAVALSMNTSIGTGFGLGLFGALSIIRLRSDEMRHQEVAYYFASLALGLLGGIQIRDTWLEVLLPIAIIAVMYFGDHPKLLGGYRQQVVTLGRAIPDEAAMVNELEQLLGGKVHVADVLRLDLVNDTTTVDVRYRTTRQ